MPAPVSYALAQALGLDQNTDPVRSKAEAAKAAIGAIVGRGNALDGEGRAAAPAQSEPSSGAGSLVSAGPGSATGAVGAAQRFLGMPYKWGGNGNGGVDCSGLTQQAFRSLGINLPRTAREQARVGTPVGSLAQAQPGDLIFYGADNHHVGIYVGGGRMIDANHTGGSVGVRPLYGDISGIRRVA